MNASLSKRAINRQRWRKRIKAWQQSGQSQKVYCQRHRLGLSSFQRWCRIFKMEEQSNEAAPVAFLPVSVKETTHSNLIVVVNDNLRIEISAGFDPNTLKQVVQTLQAS